MLSITSSSDPKNTSHHAQLSSPCTEAAVKPKKSLRQSAAASPASVQSVKKGTVAIKKSAYQSHGQEQMNNYNTMNSSSQPSTTTAGYEDNNNNNNNNTLEVGMQSEYLGSAKKKYSHNSSKVSPPSHSSSTRASEIASFDLNDVTNSAGYARAAGSTAAASAAGSSVSMHGMSMSSAARYQQRQPFQRPIDFSPSLSPQPIDEDLLYIPQQGSGGMCLDQELSGALLMINESCAEGSRVNTQSKLPHWNYLPFEIQKAASSMSFAFEDLQINFDVQVPMIGVPLNGNEAIARLKEAQKAQEYVVRSITQTKEGVSLAAAVSAAIRKSQSQQQTNLLNPKIGGGSIIERENKNSCYESSPNDGIRGVTAATTTTTTTGLPVDAGVERGVSPSALPGKTKKIAKKSSNISQNHHNNQSRIYERINNKSAGANSNASIASSYHRLTYEIEGTKHSNFNAAAASSPSSYTNDGVASLAAQQQYYQYCMADKQQQQYMRSRANPISGQLHPNHEQSQYIEGNHLNMYPHLQGQLSHQINRYHSQKQDMLSPRKTPHSLQNFDELIPDHSLIMNPQFNDIPFQSNTLQAQQQQLLQRNAISKQQQSSQHLQHQKRNMAADVYGGEFYHPQNMHAQSTYSVNGYHQSLTETVPANFENNENPYDGYGRVGSRSSNNSNNFNMSNSDHTHMSSFQKDEQDDQLYGGYNSQNNTFEELLNEQAKGPNSISQQQQQSQMVFGAYEDCNSSNAQVGMLNNNNNFGYSNMYSNNNNNNISDLEFSNNIYNQNKQRTSSVATEFIDGGSSLQSRVEYDDYSFDIPFAHCNKVM